MFSPAMKESRLVITIWVVFSALALVSAPTGAAAPPTFRLSGRVIGSSGKNVVDVALWQADGFLKRPVEQRRIEPGTKPVFQFEVSRGRWAVSAYEDRNGNGVLDM